MHFYLWNFKVKQKKLIPVVIMTGPHRLRGKEVIIEEASEIFPVCHRSSYFNNHKNSRIILNLKHLKRQGFFYDDVFSDIACLFMKIIFFLLFGTLFSKRLKLKNGSKWSGSKLGVQFVLRRVIKNWIPTLWSLGVWTVCCWYWQ